MMQIPFMMIVLSRVLKYGANRWTNIIAGAIMIAIQAGTMGMGTAPSLVYLFYSAIEITCNLVIIWLAWMWRNPHPSHFATHSNKPSLEEFMKAIVYTEYGPADVLHLSDVEKPTPEDHEVLIKVHATSVTAADCNARNFVFVPPGFGFLARLMFGLRKPSSRSSARNCRVKLLKLARMSSCSRRVTRSLASV